jgi:hypothetical protein
MATQMDYEASDREETRQQKQSSYQQESGTQNPYDPSAEIVDQINEAIRNEDREALKASLGRFSALGPSYASYIQYNNRFQLRLVNSQVHVMDNGKEIEFYNAGDALRYIDHNKIPDKSELYNSNEYLELEEMQVNVPYIYAYFTNQGWSKKAVCALLGNMQTESTMNPGIWEGLIEEKGGFGLTQWTPASKYTRWAKENNLDPKDIDTQLERIQYEVENNVQWQGFRTEYNMTFEEFTQSTMDVEDLTAIFMLSYERPRNQSKEKQLERSQQGRYWYDYFT